MNDAHSRYPVDEHRRLAAETRCGAVAIVNILERWIDLRTVLDLGCGTGVWLRVLQAGGRRQVFGVDIEAIDPADLEVDADLILTADLGRKLDLHQRYDLVVCLEVAEHIGAQFADVVVDNCVRHADLILFSAALPGQQGFNHINEQPPNYWVERFERHGYVAIDAIRPLIWDDPQIPVWYRQNMLLFAKDGSTQLEALRSKTETAASFPLALAHPDYVRWFSTQAQIGTAEAEAARQRLIQAEAEFESSLARHREGAAQARSALEAALADATRQREVESAARVAAEAAAEAALAAATREWQAESEARAVAEGALAEITRQWCAESEARTAAEVSQAAATRERLAELEARAAAADSALEDAVRRHAAEVASRMEAETALAAATHERQLEAKARRAAESALTAATSEWWAASEARTVAETALATATRERLAELEARAAAAEDTLADAVQRHAAEAASRIDAEATLAMATHERQAESEARRKAEAALAAATRERQAESDARTAAEDALADAMRRHTAEVASRVGTEKALAEATREWRAASQARATAEGALAHAAQRCNTETTARVAAEAGLADAMRRLQAAAAERAQIDKTLDELRNGLRRAETALTAATRSLQAETKARTGAEAALAESSRRRDEEVRARIAGSTALARARQDFGMAQAARDAAERAHDLVSAELAVARGEIATLCWERGIILGSTLWGATEPLRRLSRTIPPYRRQQLRRLARALIPTLRGASHPEDELVHQRPSEMPPIPGVTQLEAVVEPPSALPHAVTGSASVVRRIVFVSGEPDTPGHVYRVGRFAAAASATGAQVTCMTIPEAHLRLCEIAVANVVVIWRARDSSPLRQIIAAAREGGAKLVYDLDDLMFKPELAGLDILDGIRTMRLAPEDVAAHFSSIRDILVQADICTCTTEELANHIREYQKVAVILPNGFDSEALRVARRAVRRRQSEPVEDIVRIGYATGSRTHQRDFAQVADALARVLRERRSIRLVLFRDADSKEPVLLIDEFPALSAFADQVEWRDMVPPDLLPNELARFDINLAPVELDNVFCEAKSELKYFEAALAGVCTIASPTGPFRRAIRPAETGLLAGTSQEWYAALIALIDDVESRKAMAHAAYLDVLWRYGPEQRIEQVRSLLEQLEGGRSGARAFQLELGRRQMPRARGIVLPDSEVVFSADALSEAEVTVAIPLHNYAHYVVEALESVREQTLTSLDLVVVDDASSDDSLAVAMEWVRRHVERFNRVVVLRNRCNAGLGVTRNAGFDAAETPYVLPLDADNRLRPSCCTVCLDAIRGTGAAFAYPSLQHFGDSTDVIGIEPFQPMRFVSGNYIDALALIAKSAWAAVGGYDDIRPNGWDDYELWCSFVERGLWGVHVPQILAEYRVHERSMLQTLTDERASKLRLISELERRHSWLTILYGG